jgi:hypothetical protein
VQGLLVREVFDHWERGDLVLMGWGAIGMIVTLQIKWRGFLHIIWRGDFPSHPLPSYPT